MRRFILFAAMLFAALALFLMPSAKYIDASSHREAPLIATDPLADNTDLWVFRSPDTQGFVTIVAGYIGLELPEGGPNWTTFAQDVRYEIHIKNKPDNVELGAAKDDILYRFTFTQTNEDPTTFFNIRLGKQNLKTTYKCEKSTDGGSMFTTIISNGIVPPNYIGPRSFAGSPAGLGKTYAQVVQEAINTSSPDGEKVFCGPRDDAFFVDLGGVFDLGQTRSKFGPDPNNSDNARDAVAGYNVHCIIMNIPIEKLQKEGKSLEFAKGPLDPDFVIGVWASASRPRVTTLSPLGARPTYSPDYVQVSRLGMPLTNEAVIPIGAKDYWNAVTPYSVDEQNFIQYFANPELGLYMDDSQFGGAVPALAALRIQSRSYPAIGTLPTYSTPGFDFRNSKDGAFAVTKLNPPPNLSGTAFALNINKGLVGAGQPRLVDLYPIFYFGVPNAIPYQLATGKTGGPLSAGKPFIHNLLPLTIDSKGVIYGGDMLRLNMATPVTDRSSAEFQQNARMGLIRAAVLGLTQPQYNNTNVQAIPHMDGFPNGRRLEDDVTTIELQAVGGLVLAAVGLPFDDAVKADYSDLALPNSRLIAELTYNAGPTANDVPLSNTFPYLATPHIGYSYVKQLTAKSPVTTGVSSGHLNIGVPRAFVIEQNYPNPFNPSTEIKYQVSTNDVVKLRIYNQLGQEVTTLVNKQHAPGAYSVIWDAKNVPSGTYYYRLEVGDEVFPAKKAVLVK
jgi:hypothetical protein